MAALVVLLFKQRMAIAGAWKRRGHRRRASAAG
jgi:hypothetical protein